MLCANFMLLSWAETTLSVITCQASCCFWISSPASVRVLSAWLLRTSGPFSKLLRMSLALRSWVVLAVFVTASQASCCFWTSSPTRVRAPSTWLLRTSTPFSTTFCASLAFRCCAADALSTMAWLDSYRDCVTSVTASLIFFSVMIVFPSLWLSAHGRQLMNFLHFSFTVPICYPTSSSCSIYMHFTSRCKYCQGILALFWEFNDECQIL